MIMDTVFSLKYPFSESKTDNSVQFVPNDTFQAPSTFVGILSIKEPHPPITEQDVRQRQNQQNM